MYTIRYSFKKKYAKKCPDSYLDDDDYDCDVDPVDYYPNNVELYQK
jgi:hypothetical protein